MSEHPTEAPTPYRLCIGFEIKNPSPMGPEFICAGGPRPVWGLEFRNKELALSAVAALQTALDADQKDTKCKVRVYLKTGSEL